MLTLFRFTKVSTECSLRVGKILETKNVAYWKWVHGPFKHNPVDDATKWKFQLKLNVTIEF